MTTRLELYTTDKVHYCPDQKVHNSDGIEISDVHTRENKNKSLLFILSDIVKMFHVGDVLRLFQCDPSTIGAPRHTSHRLGMSLCTVLVISSLALEQ